jgi:hypothetical protein
MILHLQDQGFVWLRSAGGATIEVLAGRVWITEDGCAADRFVDRGRRYRIRNDGLVLIGSETRDGYGAELRITAFSAGTEIPAPRAATAHPG